MTHGIKLNFAYTTFPWDNEAAEKASVACVIVGFSYQQGTTSKLFKSEADGCFVPQEVKLISPYLVTVSGSFDYSKICVTPHKQPLSAPINLVLGSQPTDGGNFFLTDEEHADLISSYPEATRFCKHFVGSEELLKCTYRWCLFLKTDDRAQWEQIPQIVQRVEACRAFRLKSKKAATVQKAATAWQFADMRFADPVPALVIPTVSSERRAYVPMTFIDSDTIVSNLCYLLPDATYYHFGILTSRMHMCWMRLTSGRLGLSYRYSRDYTYNTFIWPELTTKQQQTLEKLAQQIINFCKQATSDPKSKMTLGKLYNPESMPNELKELFAQLDSVVEQAYRPKPFTDDDERLSFLLGLFNRRIEELKAQEAAKARAKRIRSVAAKAKAPDTATDAAQSAKPAKRTHKATKA